MKLETEIKEKEINLFLPYKSDIPISWSCLFELLTRPHAKLNLVCPETFPFSLASLLYWSRNTLSEE